MRHTVKMENQDVFDHSAASSWRSWFRDMCNFYTPAAVFLRRGEVAFWAEHAGCSESKIRRLMESLDVWDMVRAQRSQADALTGGVTTDKVEDPDV